MNAAKSTRSEARLDRYSPLYCAYNGFLLGQFICWSFDESDRNRYSERRQRMRDFLLEIDADVEIPSAPVTPWSEKHMELIVAVIDTVATRSRHLADFALLGSLLGGYGIQAREDQEMADAILSQLDGLRERYRLPPLPLERFALPTEGGHMDDILSPSLDYLAEILTELDTETNTTFVIMPFKQPYAEYFTTFYRPALEAAGQRALRAWGGLATEDYCILLLKLIEKAGMVWADISELISNVFYELGAAHACGKPALIVVRDADAKRAPSNIAHDVIARYSPAASDWPGGAIATMSALIARLGRAPDQPAGQRVRSKQMTQALEAEASELERAEQAHQRGDRWLDERDYSRAERAFCEAVELGLDDAPVLMGLGWSRLMLGRPADAEADFDAVLEQLANEHVDEGARASVMRCRARARELQEKFEAALSDYNEACEADTPDAELLACRGHVLLALGRRDDAIADAERARALSPGEDKLAELDEALASGKS